MSVAESAQCPLVRCPAQPVNHESRKGIFEIEGKAVRVAASEWSRVAARDIDGKTERSNAREPMSQSGSRTSFNQPAFTQFCHPERRNSLSAAAGGISGVTAWQAPMNTNRRCSGGCVSCKPLFGSSAVNSVGPDIERRHPRAVYPEYHAQIRVDYSRVNRMFRSCR